VIYCVILATELSEIPSMFAEMEIAFHQGEADAPSEEFELLRKRAVSPEWKPVLPETRNDGPEWLLKIHDSYYVKEHVSSWFVIYVKAVDDKETRASFVCKNRTNKCT